MRAQRLHRPAPIADRPLRLEEVAEPQPGVGQVRVSVHVCGICRTDLHVVEGDLPVRQLRAFRAGVRRWAELSPQARWGCQGWLEGRRRH